MTSLAPDPRNATSDTFEVELASSNHSANQMGHEIYRSDEERQVSGQNGEGPTEPATPVSATTTRLNDSINEESMISRVIETVVIVFPKVEPLPWDVFFVISLFSLIL